MADGYDDRSAEQIRRDIEGTRADMHETVEALERKLSVGQLVDEVWGRMGGGRSAVAAAGATVRDHPVPLALMGLGIAWLTVERLTGGSGGNHHAVGPGTWERAEGRVGPYRGDAVSHDHEDDEPSALERAKDKAGAALDSARSAWEETRTRTHSAADKARERSASAREGARDRAGSVADAARGGAAHVRAGIHSAAGAVDTARERAGAGWSRARSGARRWNRGLRSAMDEQPLAMGAVAFGLGLASGLAVPTTEWEDRTMGPAADAVKDEAKVAARETVVGAKHAAEDATAAARAEADRQRLGEQIQDSAREVAEEAKAAAQERLHDEGVDREGLKARAQDAAERAKHASRD